jgi:hypothetical protein
VETLKMQQAKRIVLLKADPAQSSLVNTEKSEVKLPFGHLDY